ncbi:hypothetical protein JOQ06_003543 [Pogonophryne albipinna]|uniref:Uncharacterized protein n=1 Tax=Pogonophryne albipinna TaxID=1090488 RepID=A0AAD6AFZ2_9TELE|nr:hypothetical protein JOQ06_003543 [Pogonophryne albipinna]
MRRSLLTHLALSYFLEHVQQALQQMDVPPPAMVIVAFSITVNILLSTLLCRNLEADFFEALDQHTPRFIQLFKSKKGSVGQKLTELMQTINWVTPDVTEQRSVVLKGIAIVLGDDSKDFFKTCFAVCLLFGLIYALHFDYPKCMANTLRFVQTVMLGLGTKTLSPKLLTLRNALLE